MMIRKITILFLCLLIIGIVLITSKSNDIFGVSDEQNIVITEENTYSQHWVIELESSLTSTPIINDGIIYLQSTEGVSAYNLETQNRIWYTTINSNERNCPMKLFENLIIAPYQYGIIAIEKNTGVKIWDSLIPIENLVIEDIEINTNYVYVATHNAYLYSYGILDGSVIWQVPVEPRSYVNLFLSGKEIIVNTSSFLKSFESDNGELIWQKTYQLAPYSLVTQNNTLLGFEYENNTNTLLEINLDNGNIQWSTPIAVDQISYANYSDEGLVITGEGLALFSIEKRQLKWINHDITNLNCPIVVDDIVFAQKNMKGLYEFSLLMQNPRQIAQQFRSKSHSDSGVNRTPIPEQIAHF